MIDLYVVLYWYLLTISGFAFGPPEVVVRVISSSSTTSRRSCAHVAAHAPGLIGVVVARARCTRAIKLIQFARGSQSLLGNRQFVSSACCGTSEFLVALARCPGP